MTKIRKSKYKISRRLGVSLWGSVKDSFHKRNYPPGQHGPQLSRKPSDHGLQLLAKQRLKMYYGRVSEKQFHRTFVEAKRLKGDTGENLVGLLERRLDNVVYRLNFGASIFASRQLVSHKHVKVNGKVVNIPSYIVKENDEIELTSKAKEMPAVLEAVQKLERSVPDYMELEQKAMKGKFIRTPQLADVPYPTVMEPSLVVEFYSR